MDSAKPWTLGTIRENIDNKEPKLTRIYDIFKSACMEQQSDSRVENETNSKEIRRGCAQTEELQQFIIELLEQIIIAKTIDRDEPIRLLLALKEINSEVLCKIICESLWIVVFDWKIINVGNECKELYQKVLQKLIDQNLVTLEMIQDQIEEDILIDCGLFNKDSYRNNKNRIRTNMIYELKQFNLLREENEGFSRLITELLQSNINESNVDTVINNIFEMIGFFRIDPNKVVDITLDCYSNNLHIKIFDKILKEFNKRSLGDNDNENSKSSIPHILEFKIKKCYEENIDPLPLIKLTAQLLKSDILQIEDVLNNNQPITLKSQTTKVVNQNKTGKDTNNDAREETQPINPLASLEMIIAEKKLKVETFYKSEHSVKLSRDSDYDAEKEKIKNRNDLLSTYENNFQLCLLEQLVRINSWRDVEIITAVFSSSGIESEFNESAIDPKWHSGYCKSLCELLNWCIEPLYRPISISGRFKNKQRVKTYSFPVNEENPEFCITQCYDTPTFFVEVPKIMKILGAGISSDALEYNKLLRVLKYQLKYCDLDDDYKKIITSMIKFNFLPSLNCVMSNELWDLIKEFDAVKRYDMYDFWFRMGSNLTCECVYNMCVTEKETLDWCKRLNNEKARENGRMLGRISCGNPLITFDLVLSSLRSYGNLIDPTLVALNYCSPLTLDCIAYTVFRHMVDFNKDKIQDNGIVSVWLQNLASFTGQFLKKFYNVDLQGIFKYLLNLMLLGQTPEMRLLKDICMQMSGWMSLDMSEMSENQIQCLAGGFLLRIEAFEYTEKLRTSKNSERSLKNALTQMIKYSKFNENQECNEESFSFAFLFMALIARNSKTLLYNTETQQLKFLSSRHDELNLLFIQISEFLMFSEKPTMYATLLPSNPLHILSRTFKLSPEQIFHIVRHCLKPLYELTPDEYNTKVAEFKDVIDYHLEQNALCINTECSDSYFNEKKYVEDQKEKIWNYITPELYMLFWYLQLSDIFCPQDKYHSTLEKLQTKDLIDNLNKKKKQKNDKAKLKSISLLKEERDSILKRIEEQEKYIKGINENLLEKISSKNFQNIRVYFIQYCMYQRLMFSPRDAIYSMKFIIMLIKMKTPYFNVVGLIGYLLKEILPCILCCTEKESHNLGIFFLELFKALKHWQIKDNWEKECDKTPAFDKTIVKVSKESISLKDLDRVVKSLNKEILFIVKICLKRDYMSARNAIIMLQKLIQVYPTNKDIINELDENMKLMIKNCEQDDLKTLADSYLSELKRKNKLGGQLTSSKPHHNQDIQKLVLEQKNVNDEETKGDGRVRKRDAKLDSKSKSRERPKSKHSEHESHSPLRRENKSKSPLRKRDREKEKNCVLDFYDKLDDGLNKKIRLSKSPEKDYKARSKSKDFKDNNKDNKKRSKYD